MRVQRLSLGLKPSLLLALALLLVHGAAIACVVLFMPNWWTAGALATAVAVSLVFHLCRDALLVGGNAVTGLSLQEGARCDLVLKNGTALAGRIEGSTFVAPWLTVINIRLDGARRRAAVLLPDCAPEQDLRRLRVWLRHRVRSDDPASRPF